VNAEVPSTYEGTMAEIIAEEGETVEVGQLICRIEVAGEEGGTEVPAKEEASAPAREEAKAPEPKPAAQKEDSNKHRYSPAVMRLAQENNIDLTQLTGTGKGGRITRKDVLKAIEEGTGRAAAPAQPSQPAAPAPEKAAEPKAAADKPAAKPASGSGIVLENGDTEIPVSSVRRTIANRMVQSKHEAPHAWTMMEVDVTGLVELRNRIKHDFQKREGVKLTFMPFFIKAVVDALKEYPILNSVWADDKIILKKRINISMATATDDALYVPVIHDADEKSILGLAKAVQNLAEKTRNGKLELADMQGGTFTVNNTGSFGSIQSQPIINAPQAAILSFEAIVKRPVIYNNMIAVRDMMNICLSLDHRILDGLVAGRFLNRVKERLEAYGPDTQI
jgi:2-oxoisovalerate dehydrogenase E2 component (dihydrolipoyl transacylase)